MEKLIRIKTEGCAIYPFNSVHKVLDIKDGVYPTLDERDRIPVKWCEELEEQHQKVSLKGKSFNSHAGLFYCVDRQQSYCWNEFRTLGYYSGTKNRTGYFKEEEYMSFEHFSARNNLDINKYE